ncbi:phosphate ABC transporter permease subunit PstC [Thalassovita sp.]|uniref:phosphate ABC transporter permease subunit PstC n=1 Tax=Thalassovita sp. TaxID=1979401 RepID=UPI0029DE6CB2|nr:phosphate ABC transporter permease subunit PstC [Thalassovita sp.]
MPVLWLFLIVLALAGSGYFLGQRRALASAGGDSRRLHSRKGYYGLHVAISTAVPSVLAMGLWLVAQPRLIARMVQSNLPADLLADSASANLLMSEVRRVGGQLAGQGGAALIPQGTTPDLIPAIESFVTLTHAGHIWMTVVVILIALAGGLLAWRPITAEYRARNTVERSIMALLIGAAALAILTTIGIVLSMLSESITFFGLHDWRDFFFGTTWAPNFRGDSELSILPLLWGTLYISLIALIVAVPVGLFAAIYLSEYAGPKTRGIAKPLLEILAGIPTIVYGLFALLSVGPLLLKAFGQDGLLGVNWMSGATSVLTAGVVMGIMLIPFVSSLSDDIINAVPQSMRDGSLGLGATQSETIRQVVIPAALPGIVGAVLLAASRAIGETMIVVMGAGAIAKFSANPLESMTTITTRIVSQLTGDGDFASPETLVAFALGLSLFVLTLGLNVLALFIVRKYREQYE